MWCIGRVWCVRFDINIATFASRIHAYSFCRLIKLYVNSKNTIYNYNSSDYSIRVFDMAVLNRFFIVLHSDSNKLQTAKINFCLTMVDSCDWIVVEYDVFFVFRCVFVYTYRIKRVGRNERKVTVSAVDNIFPHKNYLAV